MCCGCSRACSQWSASARWPLSPGWLEQASGKKLPMWRGTLLVGGVAAVIGVIVTGTFAGSFVAAMQLRGEPAELARRCISAS